MCNQSHIMSFLNRVSRQISESGLQVTLQFHPYSASLEHIPIIAIQASSHSGNRAARNMNDSRQKFSSNLVHIGNHQHQTLRRGESRAKQSSRESSVQGTSSTSFRLLITLNATKLLTCISEMVTVCPNTFFRPLLAQASQCSPIPEEGVMGKSMAASET